MGAETIGAAAGYAVGGPLGAYVGFSVGAQKANLDEVRNARRATERLENQRKKQLSDEAATREAAAASAATAGRRVGRANFTGGTGFGAGSGDTADGLPTGTLFGN